ncbi:nucleotidyltransferase domain-containing protein [Rhizobium leguminosarum]|uniref:nucleotidyltransferase domain-containing protein n=1 Tax=Rhizobium ruizarguesonis TaxID=2081791 RepID=UPI0013DF0282|nr:nucleotidyltransferase domain-containing protein [Rhizobium ruizarguesonis]NEJ31745.1 nucleotidyltransferase domain-containing protein [Rhizobium ruizarguesonis]
MSAQKLGEAVEISLKMVRRFVNHYHSTASAVVLAGSRSRESGSCHSDYDVILLFSSLPEGAWREMVAFEGCHIELFAHDLGTLAYFCREVDRPSGKPVLPTMVAEGISVMSDDPVLLRAAQKIAKETLRLGPPALDAAALLTRRYAITDLAAALRSDTERNVLLAVGSALYGALGDFALRAEGHWGASGKALPRALARAKPLLSEQFEKAFDELFARSCVVAVQTLVDTTLQPYGGRLREGYRQAAPATWTDLPVVNPQCEPTHGDGKDC